MHDHPFAHLDKVLSHSARLHIMSVLVANESYDFTSLRDLLQITDGSLATHIKALEKEQYIATQKSFIERKHNSNLITDH
jgi:DNA-binding MarR family transcriptional regulator